MGVLTKRGFKVELEGTRLKVFDKNKIILVGVRDSNNLYSLKIKVKAEVAHVAVESLKL